MRQPIIHFPKGYKFAVRQELEEAYLERNRILVEGRKEIAELQDKLTHRNMQIKELKKKVKEYQIYSCDKDCIARITINY